MPYTACHVAVDECLRVDVPNRRVKLLACGRYPAAIGRTAILLAQEQALSKVWGFVSASAWHALRQLGFVCEGVLDGYFPDGPGFAVAYYLSAARAQCRHAAEEEAIVACATVAVPSPATLHAEYRLRMATVADDAAISRVLTTVFSSYPTPIDSAEAIADARARGGHFIVIEHMGQLVSVASADVDRAHAVAEMTDCATLPAYRGGGLMHALLAALEAEMRRQGVRTVYTLARATSVGMNIVFGRLGYRYRGRLLNNCHIAGDWEDMNLWVKPLDLADVPGRNPV